MAVRKLSLDEWFLIHQLRYIRHQHGHVHINLRPDITALMEPFRSTGSPPLTEILIKSVALLLDRYPHFNRMVFHTFYGKRIVDFDKITVNVPVMVREGSKSYLTAALIEDAHKKSLKEIRADILKVKNTPLDQLFVGKFLYNRKNYFFNRLRLRFMHFVLNNFPKIYERMGGGGAAVSSLLNLSRKDYPISILGEGAQAISLFTSHFTQEGERWFIDLGVGFDHYAMNGEDFIEGLGYLNDLLSKEQYRDLLLEVSPPQEHCSLEATFS